MCNTLIGKFRAIFRTVVLLGVLLVGLVACQRNQEISIQALLPASGDVPGWETDLEPQTYTRESLTTLVDGQADSFFAYGFEQVAIQRYQNPDGVLVNVEIWQLANAADAYGLFHAGMAGQAVEIGVEGDSDPGRRLAFWQDRYFVSVSAGAPLDDRVLWGCARDLAQRLPAGGGPPAILSNLPANHLVPGSTRFFHEEISIQMELWLGGENLLGLSQETDGALAQYDLQGQAVQLLLIEYPDAAGAQAGLQALNSGSLPDVAATEVNGSRLAAVFGALEPAPAEALARQALE